jgi:DNA-binding NtrC family response regulator
MSVERNMNVDHLIDEGPGDALRLLKELARAFLTAADSLEKSQPSEIGRGLDFYEEVRRFEIQLIKDALKLTGGNQARAARLLRLKETTLHGKIKGYHISPNVLVFNSELAAAKRLEPAASAEGGVEDGARADAGL